MVSNPAAKRVRTYKCRLARPRQERGVRRKWRTVENPNWRSQSYSMLQPIDVKSPGVEAWMISKENAAILLAQLSKRGDFKAHSSGRLSNHDGQIFALEKKTALKYYRLKKEWLIDKNAKKEVINQTNNYIRLWEICLKSNEKRKMSIA